MTVKCQQAELNKALVNVASAVSARSSLPVLGNVLFEAADNVLHLTGYNLEMGITTHIPCSCDADLLITVPAGKFSSTIAALPPGVLNLDAVPKVVSLSVKHGRMSSVLKGIDADEFPRMPSLNDAAEPVTLDLSVFNAMISELAFTAATDVARPALMGINIKLTPGTGDEAFLTMETADGFRLAMKETKLEAQGLTKGITALVPAKALLTFVRITKTAKAKGKLVLGLSPKALILETDDLTFTATLLNEGNFPDLATVTPKASAITARVDVAALRQALVLADVIAAEAGHTVRLELGKGKKDAPGTLAIKAVSAESGNNDSVIDCLETTGDPIEIAFNAKYLLEIVNALPDEIGELWLLFNSPTSPGMFRPSNAPASVQKWQYITMPMYIGK